MLRPRLRALPLLVPMFLGGCSAPVTRPEHALSSLPSSTASASPAAATDVELSACRARWDAVMALPEQPGAPAFEAQRAEILGRARGEPMVFVREPQVTPDAALKPAWLASRRLLDAGRPGIRIGQLRGRHRRDPEALRALALREGYAYAPDPHDALALATQVSLPDLFTEPEIWLQRGQETRRLRLETKAKETVYRYVDGPLSGRVADLLFGDRVAASEAELAVPLHRDLRRLAEVQGFDRTRLQRRTDAALLAEVRFGERWVKGVLEAHGATLELGCLAEDRATRAAVSELRAESGPRRRALLAMHDTVTQVVGEALRFDRPEGEKTAERDGHLRPVWLSAYLQGRGSFEYDGASYPVFDREGKPSPPEVCVDFVLDTFERTAGTWFTSRGEALRRVRGRFDFDETGIENRRGVLAFGRFAETRPDIFEHWRLEGADRVQFRERSRYFAFLTDHADQVRPGDVVAIQGKKADGLIHQHAILVEWADPITGFPAGLADQMKRPRRRTWEGIMAEAPLRALLFRARPRDAVFARLDPG